MTKKVEYLSMSHSKGRAIISCPEGCPSGAYDLGEGKEAEYVMTMLKAWTRESNDRWKIYRTNNRKVPLFPRILPGRKTTIPFLERLKPLEWQDPAAAIRD
jgi:hypothetical protein